MPFLSFSWFSGSLITLLVKRSALLWSTTSTTRQSLNRKILHSGVTSNMAGTAGHWGIPKPPNVLIYTGDGTHGLEKYKEVRSVLSSLLNRDSYVTYKLDEDKVVPDPWSDNTALLVLASGNSPMAMPMEVQKSFRTYLVNGGKILSLCSSFCPKPLEMKQLVPNKDYEVLSIKTTNFFDQLCNNSLDCVMGGHYYEDVNGEDMKVIGYEMESNRPVVVQITIGKGTAFLCQVHLELDSSSFLKLHPDDTNILRLQKSDKSRQQFLKSVLETLNINCVSSKVPSLTPLYLICDKQTKDRFVQGLNLTTQNKQFRGKDVALEFVVDDIIPDPQENLLPVIINSPMSDHDEFNDEIYFSHLQTKELGRVVLYTHVITSTQQVLEGNHQFTNSIPKDRGVVVVCKQQIKGKGRGGNAWLSPLGCMMFSLMVRLKVNSELGTRLPFLQHIASLAVVEAIRSLDGYEDIDLRLKWPNDIYYGRNVKLGGVIVSSSVVNNSFTAVIGMGINLSNQKPTVCINDIIQEFNREHGCCLELLSTERLLARTLTNIEQLITEFQANGSSPFIERYYTRWLHSNAQVTVSSGNSEEVVTIIGLDEFGFLSVQQESGNIYSVQPDGNSFDMLRNLILMRQKNC